MFSQSHEVGCLRATCNLRVSSRAQNGTRLFTACHPRVTSFPVLSLDRNSGQCSRLTSGHSQQMCFFQCLVHVSRTGSGVFCMPSYVTVRKYQELFFHQVYFLPSVGMAMQRLLRQQNRDRGSGARQAGSAVATQHHPVIILSPRSSEKTAGQCSQMCSAGSQKKPDHLGLSLLSLCLLYITFIALY